MSINLNVTDEDKKRMANLLTECQVLDHLLKERQSLLQSKGAEILNVNALSPKLYALNFNLNKDTWEAILKPGSLVLPNPGIKQVRTN